LKYFESSSLFHHFYYFPSLDSTNSQCFKIKDKHNFVVLAEQQTRGKGRYNRTWVSPAEGNLYFSCCIHKPLVDFNELGILASYCVYEVLKKYNKHLYIKWPNDIIYRKKKICGILPETKFQNNSLKLIVIGIGINLFTDFSKVKNLKNIAVSLFNITDKKINRDKILTCILNLFEKYYLNFSAYKDRIILKWIDCIYHKNRDIQFRMKDKIIQGKLKKVNTDGSIVLQVGNKEMKYYFGEIA